MKKTLSLLTLIASFPLSAGTMGEQFQQYPWFASIGTGFSWTQMPGIDNPNPSQWDQSNQGYDSSLGNRGFYSFAVGKQVYKYIDVSFSYLNSEPFNYQKFQTGISGTEGFTGNARTRYFNLDNRALLISGILHPDHSFYNLFSMGLTPFAGAGIGYARNQINNFYTVGTIVVNGTAIGSTSSIGNSVNNDSFAWQGSVGLNIRPDISHVSVDVGYRYFDGGTFTGPTNIYSDSSGFVSATPWSGKLQANQAFVEFKYTV